MRRFEEWVDPNFMLPTHFEMVRVDLKDDPNIYYGCYCGLGMWSCRGLGHTVMTRDVFGWAEIPLGVDPFRDDV